MGLSSFLHLKMLLLLRKKKNVFERARELTCLYGFSGTLQWRRCLIRRWMLLTTRFGKERGAPTGTDARTGTSGRQSTKHDSALAMTTPLVPHRICNPTPTLRNEMQHWRSRSNPFWDEASWCTSDGTTSLLGVTLQSQWKQYREEEIKVRKY